MCGITGAVWTRAEKAIERTTLGRMAAALVHRGPDDEGFYQSDLHHAAPYPDRPGVALGFRRLAIIDVAGSPQPLSNEDGSIQLVFNGEIYNFKTLRQRLEGNGHTLRTTGDGETIVHLYEDLGLEFVQHLEGMFAFALWDSRRGRLVLARDRIGQKPLVYRYEPDRLLFASELKSLLTVPGLPRQVSPAALDAYLTLQYVPHPLSILEGFAKLPPGHLGVFEENRFRVERYWCPDWNRVSTAAPEEHVEQLRGHLTNSVRQRLQSDVPLGAFLSGGIDSSIVVALAQQNSSQPVQTFSIGFPEPEYDESPFARRVAAHLGTDHHEFTVEPHCVDALPELVHAYDEPFADSSAIPTFFLSRLTREHVTVAISGDGGDELYAGYRRYQAVRLAQQFDRLPRPLQRLVASKLWQKIPASGRQKDRRRMLKRLLAALSLVPPRRYAEWVSIFNEVRRAELYHDDFLTQLPQLDPVDFLIDASKEGSERDAVTQACLTDLLTYLPCDLCTKVDIASMANGLECRQPMLDHHVVEHAFSIPVAEKQTRGGGKQILRRAFGSLVPQEVFTRKKQGFGVPLDHWFRGELNAKLRDVLLDRPTLERGYFQPQAVKQLITEHESGQFDHAHRLWSLFMLEQWHRRWLESESGAQ